MMPTRRKPPSVHLLAYFVAGDRRRIFYRRGWRSERLERRQRNRQLAAKLQKQRDRDHVRRSGSAWTIAGRPSPFCPDPGRERLCPKLGRSISQYLGEDAPSFVPRQSKTAEEVIGIGPLRRRRARDRASRSPGTSARTRAGTACMNTDGLVCLGLEIYHSEHPPDLQAYYGSSPKSSISCQQAALTFMAPSSQTLAGYGLEGEH